MHDKIKLIIEIPKELYKNKKGYLTNMDAHIICKAVQNGTPLDSVKTEIAAKEMAETNTERQFYNMALGDVIEIIDNIGKTESERTE